MTPPALRPATPADWPAIAALLDAHALPLDGAQDHLAHFLVAQVSEVGGPLLGCAGLEVYGDVALLRSVAVAPARRGLGLGGTLVEAASALATRLGVRELFLLTTTAADWFARRGWTPTTACAVPAALRASREFQGACPASAACLRRLLVPQI